MSNLADLETRLEDLVRAHRALSARNEAMFQTCKIMFAFIDAPLPMLQRLLQSVHRATLHHMNHAELDQEYQSLVEAALSELQAVALASRR